MEKLFMDAFNWLYATPAKTKEWMKNKPTANADPQDDIGSKKEAQKKVAFARILSKAWSNLMKGKFSFIYTEVLKRREGKRQNIEG